MDKRYRDMERELQRVADQYGATLSGPEHRGNTHLRYTMELDGQRRYITASCSPRNLGAATRCLRSEARRCCREMLA